MQSNSIARTFDGEDAGGNVPSPGHDNAMNSLAAQPIRRPLASPLAINAAAVGAIILRDIRLRAGKYYAGFLMVLVSPLLHLLFIVTLFSVLGRLAPEGTDELVYFGVSILPFVIYLYLARQIVLSLIQNRPLLNFSRVKVFDILLARGILESAGAFIVFLILVSILSIFSSGFSPRDWPGIVFAVAATIYLGFSVGVPNAMIARVFPTWLVAFNLSMPLIWMSSGVIFFPAAIPEPYDQWLALNPLLQCIEWIRYSYYEDYPDKLLNIPYLLSFATACLVVSLVAERLVRRALRAR
ncbi:MAG: ABC transporter permease [Beijerinckiaceae bacterium]|nr:ABC transporter permease [Beijerinckiaceae bacterium]